MLHVFLHVLKPCNRPQCPPPRTFQNDTYILDIEDLERLFSISVLCKFFLSMKLELLIEINPFSKMLVNDWFQSFLEQGFSEGVRAGGVGGLEGLIGVVRTKVELCLIVNCRSLEGPGGLHWRGRLERAESVTLVFV